MSAPRPSSEFPLERFALPLLLVLAAALRVREALRTPLWYDELYTLGAASQPWSATMKVVRADVHPPLHFALTSLWRVFGSSDLAVRSLAITFGVAGVAATWALAREWFGPRVALLSTLMIALHPWHVYGSQEARSYPMLWLWLTLSALGAWRWSERGGRGNALLFVLASALALWTHYLAGIVLFAQWLWGVARLRREGRRLMRWCGLHAAVGILFLPDVPMWWRQLHRTGADTWTRRPGLSDLADVMRRLAFSRWYLAPVVTGLALLSFRDARIRRAATFAMVLGPLTILVCWVLARRAS